MARPRNTDENDEAKALELRLKRLKVGSLSKKEQAFLLAWLNKSEEDIRSRILKNVTKTVYAQMAGRVRSVVDEFGKRYGLPITGPTINLYQAIDALHTRIAELAAIAKPHLDANESELQKMKLREEIAKLQGQSQLLNIELQTRKSELVKRDDVVENLLWLSGQLVALGNRLNRVGGPETRLALNEFLESIASELEQAS